MSYTKQQVEDFTLEQLPDNVIADIEPDELRNVFLYHREMEKLASYVKFVNAFLNCTTAEGALNTLASNNIPSWSDKAWPIGYFVFYSDGLYRSNEAISTGETNPAASSKWDKFGSLTAIQIRDLLHTLTSTNRVNKSAVRGADFSLNRRGQGDILNGTYASGMTHILKGDFWIYEDESSSGGTDSISEWDWVVALKDDADPSDYDTADWWTIKFSVMSAGTNMTATAIRDALKTLAVAEMLPLANVMYDTGTTAKTKLDGKNDKLYKRRIIFDEISDAGALTIPNTNLLPLTFCINRVPYVGVLGTSYDGWDFKYEHVGIDTVITMNPGVNVLFVRNDIIDILYTAA